MIQVSLFLPPVHNLTPNRSMFLTDVFLKIKTSKTLQEKIIGLRSLKEKSSRDNFKKSQLPGVTFCGIFSQRTDKDIITHSSIVCVDIDGLSEDEMVTTKAALGDIYKELIGYFVSPSGNGYKVLVLS